MKPRLTWDERFMEIAQAASAGSKDASTQVGACLVSPDLRSVVIGYNGFPAEIPDDPDVLAKRGYFRHAEDRGWMVVPEAQEEDLGKHDLVVHAELNAILNCRERPQGWTLYCTHIPCAQICARHIVAAGIRRVVALGATGETDLGYTKTGWIFKRANVEFEIW